MTAPCGLCGAATETLRHYTAPPVGETDFGLAPYARTLTRCPVCGHVENRHDMFDRLGGYAGGYVDATYGDRLARTFRRIMDLPADRSDNRARVAAVDDYAAACLGGRHTLLDIGSGLAVFPAVMAERGWAATALDPDPRAATHADGLAGVRGLAGDFMTWTADRAYHLVSLVKVLEHVADMPAMLARLAAALAPGGVAYIEVPDGEGAVAGGGPDREEFFVEHYCAFSTASLALLLAGSALRLDRLDRLVEPSGKYTLRAFCRCR